MWLILVVVLRLCASLSVPSLEQISRQELVYTRCENTSSSGFGSDVLDHVLVEPKHKLLYCYVPKVACTNWKRILYILSGHTNNTNLTQIPANQVHEPDTFLRFNQLKPSKITEILSSYKSLLVVRHPFERLLSAFRNKFEGVLPSAKYFQIRIGRHIIRKYRKNANNSSLETGFDVTFREFVQYLIEEGLNQTRAELINEHWRPIFQICRPCDINYTFIVKYEFLIQEAEIFLDLIDAPEIDFPLTKVSRTGLRLGKYYQQLSLMEIKMLYFYYKMDFEMFGYNLENVLGFDVA